MPVLRVIQNTFFKRATLSASNLSTQDKVSVTTGQTFEVRYAFRVGNHCFVELARSLGTVGRLGYFYPSPIAQDFIGSAVIPNPNFDQQDMLAELTEVAKPLNFRVIPWFEYGLKAPPNAAIVTRNRHLITADQQGNLIQNGNVWLNPAHPEVQQFIIDLIKDVVIRYDIAGVQLDDDFGLPAELGYDPFTRALYRQENQDQLMPLTPVIQSDCYG
ncbi:family 10 glycosylhydrolase [Leptodesmis sp.]|uniref:family 10 glycosylhydrolase n=1 Tax=Leptodesmis sp. TaxID=3100501 RepID=UPI0040535855